MVCGLLGYEMFLKNLQNPLPPPPAPPMYLMFAPVCTSYGYEYYSSYSATNSSAFTSFHPFVFSFFYSLIASLIFYFPQKLLIKKQIT